jgi:hypothetical protein
MMRYAVALGAALLLGGAAQPSADQAAQPRWHLDGSTTRCVLTRRLAGTPGPAAFILRTLPGSGTYDVMLAVPDLGRGIGRVRISTAPDGATHEQRVMTVDLPRGLGEALAIPYLPASFSADFSRASRLALADAEGRPLGSWTLPAAARAAEALAACETEKLVEWGADPAALEPGATPPRPIGDPARWLEPRDLGLGDLMTAATVAAVFRLTLAADGRATDCTILESAGSIEIDRGACRALVRRARYEPARDRNGNAVRSVAIHRLASETSGPRVTRSWGASVPSPAR